MTKLEKRTAKRIQYKCTINFRSEKSIMETVLDMNNISMSGVYVATNNLLDIGTRCSVEMRLHNEKDEPFILLAEGVISRVDIRGQGIEFTAFDEENRAKLHEIVSEIKH